MTDIIREGVRNYLDQLDHKELMSREAKRHDRARGRTAFVPHNAEHPWGPAPGLGFREKAIANQTKVPERIQNSFRRFAEYVEGTRDKIEREVRAQVVIDEIKSRVDKPEEVDASCMAFAQVLHERAAHHRIAKVAVSPGAIIEGDIDENEAT